MKDFKEIITENKLTEAQAKPLDKFGDFFLQAHKLTAKSKSIKVTKEDDFEGMDKAKESRKELKELRVESDKLRKKLKEGYLRGGKAVQVIYNQIRDIIEPEEKRLLEQEKFAEIKAEKRLLELENKRILELSKFIEDVSIFDLKSMSDEDFTKLLNESEKNLLAREKQKEDEEKKKQLLEKKNQIHSERLQKLMPYGQFLDLSNFTADSDDNEFNNLLLEGREKKLKDDEKRQKEFKELEKVRKQKELEEKIEQEKQEKLSKSSDKEKLLNYIQSLKNVEKPNFGSEKANSLFLKMNNSLLKFFEMIIKQSAEL